MILDRPDKLRRYLAVQPDALVAAWPLRETSGMVARLLAGSAAAGAYSGPTLAGYNKGGIPAPSFDGVNDYVNVYSSALNTAFDGQELSIGLWYNTALDATTRFMARFGVDGNNEVRIYQTDSDTIRASYVAGGQTDNLTFSGVAGWQHLLMTVSLSAGADGEFKVFNNGVQSGSTTTSLGTFSGSLSSSLCVLGASDSGGSSPFLGGLHMVMVWSQALTDAEVLRLAS